MSVTYKRHPDFFVIGGLCCATSALARILQQRPEIALRGNSGDLKNDVYIGNVERDLSRFSAVFSSLDPNKLCGAIMPHYLVLPEAAGVIHDLASYSRMVVILRDPLDRLRSHYLYNVAAGIETHPFEVSIQQEDNRCSDGSHLNLVRYGYLRQGCYAELLEPYRSVFDPEKIHVIYMDKFLSDTDNELARLYKFLGFMKTLDIALKKDISWTSSADKYREAVEPPYPSLYKFLGPLARTLVRSPGQEHSSEGSSIGHYLENALHPLPSLKRASRKWIRDYYAPHDKALADWLGEPPPWSPGAVAKQPEPENSEHTESSEDARDNESR
jgi:hypothetical protein